MNKKIFCFLQAKSFLIILILSNFAYADESYLSEGEKTFIKWLVFFSILGIIKFLAPFLKDLFNWSDPKPHHLEGKMMPEFHFYTNDTNVISTTDFAGKVVILLSYQGKILSTPDSKFLDKIAGIHRSNYDKLQNFKNDPRVVTLIVITPDITFNDALSGLKNFGFSPVPILAIDKDDEIKKQLGESECFGAFIIDSQGIVRSAPKSKGFRYNLDYNIIASILNKKNRENVQKCASCGVELNYGHKYCTNCGERTVEENL